MIKFHEKKNNLKSMNTGCLLIEIFKKQGNITNYKSQ